ARVLKRESSRSSQFSLAFAGLAGALAISWASPSFAQDKGAPEEAPPVEEAAPLTTEEKQAKAIELFKAGQALLDEQKYDDSIKSFEEAFELFPDPGLQVKIGEAYQRAGAEERDYDKLRKSVEAYKKYVELVPEGPTTD